MWQWHLWAGPGGPGVWVSTGALVGQGDPWWPPWPGSGLEGPGLGPGPTSCQWSPLWAALVGSGCCSTTSPVQLLGGPVATLRQGCRRRRQSYGDAAPVPLAGLLCGSAGHNDLSLATTSASRCQDPPFLEAPKSCSEKRLSSSFNTVGGNLHVITTRQILC